MNLWHYFDIMQKQKLCRNIKTRSSVRYAPLVLATWNVAAPADKYYS